MCRVEPGLQALPQGSFGVTAAVDVLGGDVRRQAGQDAGSDQRRLACAAGPVDQAHAECPAADGGGDAVEPGGDAQRQSATGPRAGDQRQVRAGILGAKRSAALFVDPRRGCLGGRLLDRGGFALVQKRLQVAGQVASGPVAVVGQPG